MDPRSCDATHFILTIGKGLVTKLRNTDSYGSPAILYKSLKDVYESENATRLQRSGPNLLNSAQVKLRDFPVVGRALQEIKSEPDEFVCHVWGGGSNELDDNTTLKQLRKRLLAKKRKHNRSDENFLVDNANEDPEEDDLYELLIKLKSTGSRTSKTKRKCKNPSLHCSSKVDIPVKAEENLSSEGDSLQVACQFDQVIRVKIEVPDTEQLECQSSTSSADDSFMAHTAGLDSGGSSSNEYQDRVQHEYQNYVTDEITYGHLEDAEPISWLGPSDGMSVESETDEIPFSHLENAEPISILVPSDGMSTKLETLESGCKHLLDSLVSENGKEIEEVHFCSSSKSQDANSNQCGNSGCPGNMNVISEQNSSSEIQVSDIMTTEADYPCELHSFLSVPGTKFGSCLESINSLQIKENGISHEGTSTHEEQRLTPTFDYTTKNDLDCEVHIEDETDELCKDEEKQTLASSISGAESHSSLKDQSCESSETLSSSEQHVPPEGLLSTRKAMSPSSQQRLCMVMNAIDFGSDADLSTVPDLKGKFFEKQTRKKASIERSDIQDNKSAVSHTGPQQANPLKVIISPRIVKKKSKIAKGNLEGPHFSRTLPNFSTGCNSIQGCSESAIAFSQRQMHDMEFLTEKLMNELKSMRDIVEQKLLFESFRNNSLKNDADGVKSTIHNATKVEDTARKWLSMMSRDCSRFCKIMKMAPNSTTIAKDATQREEEDYICG